jgi:hypothetical protein
MVLVYGGLFGAFEGLGEVCIPSAGLGDIALTLKFVCEFLLVVVEEGGVGDDDEGY